MRYEVDALNIVDSYVHNKDKLDSYAEVYLQTEGTFKKFFAVLSEVFSENFSRLYMSELASLYNLLKFSKDELRNVKTFLKC